MSSDWYWAELRSATAAGEVERGWQLLAAWPSSPTGDPHEAENARKYFMTGVFMSAGTEKVADTAWMLQHFRMMPVPLTLEEPTPDDGVRDEAYYENYGRIPPHHPWNGQVLRLIDPYAGSVSGGGSHPRLVVTDEGGEVALEANLQKDAQGRPFVFIRRGLARYGNYVLGRRGAPASGEGLEEPDQCGFGGEGIQGAGLFDVYGMETLGRLARLMGRFSKELEALGSPESNLSLAWEPDILSQLRQEGSALHPSLLFVKEGMAPGSQMPSRALREKWLGLAPKALRPEGTVNSWYGSPALEALLREVYEFLCDNNLHDLNPWEALALSNMSAQEVAEASGDVAEIQLERHRVVLRMKPLLDRLEAERLVANRGRNPRLPRVGDVYTLVQEGGGDEGDEEDDDIELE